MIDHLLRAYAPIPTVGWQQIDDEAKSRLAPGLAARRMVGWSGPHGWAHSATNLGRTVPLETTPPGTKSETVIARQRRVLPLCEFRVSFTVECSGLQDAERGANDVDYADLDRAAYDAALIENRAVFHGWPDAGISGLTESSAHPPIDPRAGRQRVPARRRQSSRCAPPGRHRRPVLPGYRPGGVHPDFGTTERGGYPLQQHLSRIVGGDIVWAPGLDGALLVSKRSGDFVLDVGQDLSIGYTRHDAELVTLYLEESFSFRVNEPSAVVVLTDA